MSVSGWGRTRATTRRISCPSSASPVGMFLSPPMSPVGIWRRGPTLAGGESATCCGKVQPIALRTVAACWAPSRLYYASLDYRRTLNRRWILHFNIHIRQQSLDLALRRGPISELYYSGRSGANFNQSWTANVFYTVIEQRQNNVPGYRAEFYRQPHRSYRSSTPGATRLDGDS